MDKIKELVNRAERIINHHILQSRDVRFQSGLGFETAQRMRAGIEKWKFDVFSFLNGKVRELDAIDHEVRSSLGREGTQWSVPILSSNLRNEPDVRHVHTGPMGSMERADEIKATRTANPADVDAQARDAVAQVRLRLATGVHGRAIVHVENRENYWPYTALQFQALLHQTGGVVDGAEVERKAYARNLGDLALPGGGTLAVIIHSPGFGTIRVTATKALAPSGRYDFRG